MTNLAEKMAQGWRHHQAGALDLAEQHYRQVLQVDPSQVDALYLCGVVRQVQGDVDGATALYNRVLALRPQHVEVMSNLGAALASRGRFQEAVQWYRRALHIKPDYPGAYNNLGIALTELGELDEAVVVLEQAIRLNPGAHSFHYNLGRARQRLGQLDGAASAYRQALALRPGAPETLNDLGTVLVRLDRVDEAIELFRMALALNGANRAEASNNLGAALAAKGNHEEALTFYHQALQAWPDYADACNNLGISLTKLQRLDQAAGVLQHAIRLDPSKGSYLHNLVVALHRAGRLEKAEAAIREALARCPGMPEALNDLGATLAAQRRYDEAIGCYQQALQSRPDYTAATDNLATALGLLGRLDEAESCLRQGLRLNPNEYLFWNSLGLILMYQARLDEAQESLRKAMDLAPDDPQVHGNFLVCRSYDPKANSAELLSENRAWGQRHGRPAAANRDSRYDRHPERRLRVGYVSPDLCGHPVGYFVEPILQYHAAAQFETFCYAEVPVADSMTDKLRGLAKHWRWTYNQSDAQLAEQVRADQIDILVDLAGHTFGNRLRAFAQRLALVQVTYLGYPNTTGLESIDYFLTDALVDPPGEPTWATEELVRLPGCFCCYAPPSTAPDVSSSPALQCGHVTLGSLQNLAKINSDVLDLWCRLLRALPTARLLVFRNTLRGLVRDRLLHQFQQRGIDARRLELRHEPEALGHYLGVYRHVDLSLDTLPWSGHTTACESLWMGVPFLTLCGNRHSGRMATSVLSCLGLNELVARTPDEFVAAGVRLGSDLNHLAEMRRELRGWMQASPLCDGAAFTRKLEATYRSLWQRWIGRQ